MKKLISVITVLVLCFSLLSMNVFAASASAKATGPKSVEVGETLQVTLTVSGSDIYGLSGKLNYDDTMLKLKSSSCKAKNWQLEFNGDKFVAYDNMGENPINSSVKLIVLKFTVLKAAAKQTVEVKFTNLVATDAKNDINMSDATFSCSAKEKSSTPAPTTAPVKPTEPAPTEAPTEAPTQAPTEAPTEAPTVAPTEPAPTEPVDLDGKGGCELWWLWILLLIIILVVVWLIVKKAKKK